MTRNAEYASDEPDPHAYLCKHCRVPVVDHADLADCYEFLEPQEAPSYRCIHGSPRYLCVLCEV